MSTQTTLTVNVVRVPGPHRPVMLEDGATVADALNVLEIDPAGWAIRVGGEEGHVGTTLSDGATVILTRQVKGN